MSDIKKTPLSNFVPIGQTDGPYCWMEHARRRFDIPISRRNLLKSPVAIALVSTPIVAFSGDSKELIDEKLRFELSEDKSELTVLLQRVVVAQGLDNTESAGSSERAWTLKTEMFGDEARFDLYPNIGSSGFKGPNGIQVDSVQLRITRVAYGRNPFGEVIYNFSKSREQADWADDNAEKQFHYRWGISASTTVWGKELGLVSADSEHGSSSSNDAKTLYVWDYIGEKGSSKKQLQGRLQASGVRKSLALAFNDLLQVVRQPTLIEDTKPVGTMGLALSSNGIWTITSGPKAWLRPMFAGLHSNRIEISNVINQRSEVGELQTLGVLQNLWASQQLNPSIDYETFEPENRSIEKFVVHIHDRVDEIDNDKDTAIRLTGLSGEVTCAFLSGKANQLVNSSFYRDLRVEAILAGSWDMVLAVPHVDNGDTIAGPFRNLYGVIKRASAAALSSTTFGGKILNEELSFAAAVQNPVDKDEQTRKKYAQWVTTPIGPVQVDGLSLNETKVSADSPNGVSGNPFAVNPFDLYQASPIWLTSHGSEFDTGEDHARTINWLEMHWILLESSLSLPDASVSRFKFESTEVVMLYQATAVRALPRNYIWLHPSRERQQDKLQPSLARIDVSRAKLKAARHSDLVSLKFSFSRLFLVVDTDVRIVPEGPHCGIYTQPGQDKSEFQRSRISTENKLANPEKNNSQTDQIQDDQTEEEKKDAPTPSEQRLRVLESVDSRPLLVVEFPPQHIMEQAFFKPRLPNSPDVDFSVVAKDEQKPYLEFDFTDPDNPKLPVRSKDRPEQTSKDICAPSSAKFSIDVRNPAEITSRLLLLDDVSARLFVRTEVHNIKAALKVSPNDTQVEKFVAHADAFSSKVKLLVDNNGLTKKPTSQTNETADNKPFKTIPHDQAIYIGPFAMDPDVADVNRDILQENKGKLIESGLGDTLLMVNQKLRQLEKELHKPVNNRRMKIGPELAEAASLRFTDFSLNGAGRKPGKQDLLPIESYLESQVPAYQLFRNGFRENKISRISPEALLDKQTPEIIEFIFPGLADVDTTNTIWLNEKSNFDFNFLKSSQTQPAVEKIDHAKECVVFIAVYLTHILSVAGEDGYEQIADARLSKPTRLAFRINCRDGLVDARNLANTPRKDYRGQSNFRASLKQGLDYIPFSLLGLTDWSAMELSVVSRAERVFAAGPDGRLDQNSSRTVNLHGAAKLDHLGFAPNSDLETRRWHYRANHIVQSLRQQPGWDQTAIELPSRLTLSTSQQAIFKAPSGVNSAIFKSQNDHDRKPLPLDCFGQPMTRAAHHEISDFKTGFKRLWSADLVSRSGTPDPDLRAVHSPDVSPDALLKLFGSRIEIDGRPLPGFGAPPRGSYAPWLLGRSQTSRTPIAPDKFVDAVPKAERGDGLNQALESIAGDDGKNDAQKRKAAIDEICKTEPDGKSDGVWKHAKALPSMFIELCRTWRSNSAPADGLSPQFRTSLDAYDRHELVMLTSAFGLPVMPRGSSVGVLETTRQASQFKPDEDYLLGDVMPEQEIYRPSPLNVAELSLTSLGANFTHDTSFTPPASAKYFDGSNLFDAFSVERWQYATSLGRDIYCEIVYKGFLYPFGFKASLVKVTERIFSKAPDGSIKAYLRQRMFIRCADREKSFGALGQAYEGRRFPARSVRLLTENTPDIVDPTSVFTTPDDTIPIKEHATGRLLLGDEPGLIFWPRTAMARRADVRFELELDSVFTTCPLLFVDNVAVNDPQTLELLQHYYNNSWDGVGAIEGVASPDHVDAAASVNEDLKSVINPIEHRRTLNIAGVKLRYAEENRTGSCSLHTEAITLRVEGRVSGNARESNGDALDKPAIAFNNNRYSFDAVLQGADQPPFYPVLETARIRLTQNAQLTGRPAKVRRACYDGSYVVHGFTSEASEENPQREIFLNLIDPVGQSMGSQGDQSGGVFRPDGALNAISRSTGPIALPLKVNVQRIKFGVLPAYSVSMGANVSEKNTSDTLTDSTGLTEETETPPAQNGKLQLTPPKAPDPQQSTKNIFAKAKLLGMIKFSDIIDLVTKPGSYYAPELLETVEYGASVVSDNVDDALELVRKNVVDPLTDLIAEAIARWERLDQELIERQKKRTGEVVEPITIAELFPELNKALVEFEQALIQLNQKIEEEGSSAGLDKLFVQLTTVYETGQRLLDAIRRAATNPVERLETALESRYSVITAEIDTVINIATGNLEREFKKQVEDLPNKIADAIFEEGNGDLLFSVPLPGMSIYELIDSVHELMDDATIKKLEVILSVNQADAKELLRLLIQALLNIGDGGGIRQGDDAALETVAGSLKGYLNKKKVELEDVFKALDSSVKARLNAQLEDAFKIYDLMLDSKENLRLIINGELDKLEGILKAKAGVLSSRVYVVLNELRYARDQYYEYEHIWKELEGLIRTGNIGQVFEKVFLIATRLLGSEFTSQVFSKINEIEKPLAKLIKETIEDVDFTELGLISRHVVPESATKTLPAGFPDKLLEPKIVAIDLVAHPGAPDPSEDTFVAKLYTLHESIVGEYSQWENFRPSILTEIENHKKHERFPDELKGENLDNLITGIDDLFKSSHQFLGGLYCDIVNDSIMLAGLNKRLGEVVVKLDAIATSGSHDSTLYEQLDYLRVELRGFVSARKAVLKRTERRLKDFEKVLAVVINGNAGQESMLAAIAALLLFAEKENLIMKEGVQVAVPIASIVHRSINAVYSLLKGIESSVTQTRKFINDGLIGAVQEFDVIKSIVFEDSLEEFLSDWDSISVESISISLDELIKVYEKAEIDTFGALGNATGTATDRTATAGAATEPLTLSTSEEDRLKIEALADYFENVKEFVEKQSKKAYDDKATDSAELVFKAIEDINIDGIIEALELTNIGDRAAKVLKNAFNKKLSKLYEQLDDPVVNIFAAIGSGSKKSLAEIYGSVAVARKELFEFTAFEALFKDALIIELDDSQIRSDIVGSYERPTDEKPLDENNDRLAADVAWLTNVGSANSKPISDEGSFSYIKLFIDEWASGTSTPLLMIDGFGDRLKSILKGDIDLDELFNIRGQIESYILNLVPTKYKYEYDVKFPLPSEMQSATGGIFIPGKECELGIGVQAAVDLLPKGIPDSLDSYKPAFSAKALATLGSFDIKLVGDIFDAVTLKFSGARFVSDLGSDSDFNVGFEDFVIGEQLEFIQDLQSYMTPNDGSGVFIQPLKGKPGIEAGYGLSLGTIMIGNVAFANVSLNASAELPFDGGDDSRALFKASLSRRDAPFTIAYIPYGGSGFFAIIADSKGIVGFEMSLEFGAAAPFKVGPLVGQGRIMAGFYIKMIRTPNGNVSEIYATFYVGGSASIWIFNISASLYVRLGQASGGEMKGLAIFTFSFSMGLADFDFTVRFEKQEKKGFGAQGTDTDGGYLDFLESDESWGVNHSLPYPTYPSRIQTDTECQSCDWKVYRSYFDDSFDFEAVL